MDSKIKLKPCPFCGSDAIVFINDGVCVICTDCGAQTPTMKDDIMRNDWPEKNCLDKVVDIWNRRYPK